MDQKTKLFIMFDEIPKRILYYELPEHRLLLHNAKVNKWLFQMSY